MPEHINSEIIFFPTHFFYVHTWAKFVSACGTVTRHVHIV